VQLRLLGPVDVVREDGPVPVPGAKERALLACLGLHADEAVPADRLIDILWGDNPPRTAAKTLRSYVSRLRTFLDVDPGSITVETTADGYRLSTGGIENALDVAHVEALMREAERAMAADNAVRAADRLGKAARTWRGRPLGEVADEPWAIPHVTRLSELRLAVLEARIDADLACGRHASLTGELEALCAQHPLRERLWAQRITALYRSGRQADALRVYQELRRSLADELGIDPSPELQALEQAVLNHDPSLDAEIGLKARPDEVEVPLPGRLLVEPWGTFVGREAERKAVLETLQSGTAIGSPRLVLVTGSPGVGKTTLVAEAARAAAKNGACILYGRCDEQLGVAYQPFAEMFGHIVANAAASVAHETLADSEEELARFVPGIARRAQPQALSSIIETDTERFRLYGAVGGSFARLAALAPVLAIIDDLHWADATTVQMLHFLLTSPEAMRVVVLATYRDEEVAPDHPLAIALAAWRRDVPMDRLTLAGFDDAEIAELIDAAPTPALSDTVPDVVETVRRETGGNPFFVAEFLRHLAESGGGLRELDVPEGVRDVIAHRVHRLGAKATRMLEAAAVVGVDFDAEIVGRAADLTDEEMADFLDRAERASLVRGSTSTPGQYSFVHGLVPHTLYGALSAARRTRLHRRVAEALEELAASLPVPAADLARHWIAAPHPDAYEKAARYGLDAGRAALMAMAPDEAARQFEQAVNVLQAGGQRDQGLYLDLLIGLGEAQRRIGEAAHRENLLEAAERARQMGDTKRLVAAAITNSRGATTKSGDVDWDRVAVLEAALEALPADDSAERALLLATLCAERTYLTPLDVRRRLADEARAIALRLDDPALVVRVANLIGFSTDVPETLAQRLEETAETVAMADRLGDPAMRSWAYFYRAMATQEAGRCEEAEACEEVFETLAAEVREPYLAWCSAYRKATRANFRGDPVEGERWALEGLQIGNDYGQQDALIAYSAGLIAARYETGQLGELVPLIAQFVADNPTLPAYKGTLALALLQSGDIEGASRVTEEAAETRFEELPVDYVWLITLQLYAQVSSRVPTHPGAELLYDILRPWSDQASDVGSATFGPTSYYLAILCAAVGRREEADRWFNDAATFCERAGAIFFVAQTQLAWGRMLLDDGCTEDRDRAATLISSALDAATARGYAALAAEADALLAT
jgi:DNA-binding SARP family transcriptional activator